MGAREILVFFDDRHIHSSICSFMLPYMLIQDYVNYLNWLEATCPKNINNFSEQLFLARSNSFPRFAATSGFIRRMTKAEQG